MKGLMHICESWGTGGCHPDIIELKYPKELKEGEKIPTWPAGEELKKLDEICKKCKSNYFIVEEEKCPVCDNIDVEETGGSHDMPGRARAHGFKCSNCGTKFWIFEKN